jgi:PIN domain nuclease of toxin-antitoxin system
MPLANSTEGLLLDTHIWVRYINGDPSLKPSAVSAIEAARTSGNVFVSVISVWEIALLFRKRRLALPLGVHRWVQQAFLLPGVQLLPFTIDIAIESVDLPDSLNKDPSDRILVATARIEGLRLVTHDKDIIRFAKQHKLSLEIA